jgi:hypothetical protein
MKYTTVENIARRLRGRLNIEETPPIDTALTQALGYGNVVAGNVVDPETITLVAERKEGYIDLILSQIYVTPLRLSHEVTRNILADISESLSIAGLIQIHFEGSNPIMQASDISQTAMNLDVHAKSLLQQITAGSNIYIAVSPPVDHKTLHGERQPLRLPGERLLGRDQIPDNVTKNTTVVQNKTKLPGKHYFGESDSTAGFEPRRYPFTGDW